MDTVAQQISLLKISTPPFETVYINDRRVHDHFLGQLGAVKEMVWNAQRRGGGKASFNLFGAGIEGGGELGSERERFLLILPTQWAGHWCCGMGSTSAD